MLSIIFLYGTASVLIISLVGMAILVMLPYFQNEPQSNLSQMFVGLAVGTLTSDAFLHLLPHAFSSNSDHHDRGNETHQDVDHHQLHTETHHSHSESVWFGVMALVGIIGFLVFERIILIISDLLNKPTEQNDVTEKEAKCSSSANYNLAPERQKLNNHYHNHHHQNNHDSHHSHEMKELINGSLLNGQDLQVHDECHRSTISYPKPDGEGYMHLAVHHHHHHKAHRGPSAAMMVLFGDVLHNLFDGLAIGVAFSGSGIGGGISTSIAVLFHELPHELGDFTIIIRSGMSLRRAFCWNIIASVVCWFGMLLGIYLGKIQDAWLSALIAGTFLYISLVDMVPELDSCPHLPSKNRAIKLSVQLIGIIVGFAIMLLISLYENKLLSLF